MTTSSLHSTRSLRLTPMLSRRSQARHHRICYICNIYRTFHICCFIICFICYIFRDALRLEAIVPLGSCDTRERCMRLSHAVTDSSVPSLLSATPATSVVSVTARSDDAHRPRPPTIDRCAPSIAVPLSSAHDGISNIEESCVGRTARHGARSRRRVRAA